MIGLCFVAIVVEAKAQTTTSGRLADTGTIEFSGQAMRLLEQQLRDKQAAPHSSYSLPSIRTDGGNLGSGSANFDSGVYTGTFRRVINPYSGNAYWTLYEGIYKAVTGVQYKGRFHHFHENSGEHSFIEEDWTLANRRRYMFVGSRAAPDGASASGIYSVEASMHAMPEFTPADEHYIAAFEKRYASQVNRFRQAQATEASSGLSFGQVLALGLGAAALSQANIPGADAASIGGTFAADILTGGKTGALVSAAEAQRTSGQHRPAVTRANAAKTATAKANSESVTVSCPSGASKTMPISYKTQYCRSAMIEFARVYSCNLIDDFSAVGQRCQSTCGHPQCLQ